MTRKTFVSSCTGCLALLCTGTPVLVEALASTLPGERCRKSGMAEARGDSDLGSRGKSIVFGAQ
jgi:hypothetical protein